MTDANEDIVSHVNGLAEQRFELEVAKQHENQSFKDVETTLKAAHEAVLARLQSEIDRVDAQLWSSIEEHRESLIEHGKQSFVTMIAQFQLRHPPAKAKVSDPAEVLKVARRLGVIRQIAEPPKGGWKLNSAKFLAWLDRHGEYHAEFEEYLEEVGGDESLTIKSNGTYTVHHDSRRISPPSVKIEKKKES